MTEPGDAATRGASGRASPLARAFWGWFVAGGVAALAAGVLSLVLISVHPAAGVLAAAVWLLGIPAWAIAALVLVWRRGARAPARWRHASRAGVLGCYALVALAVLAMSTMPGDYTVKAKVHDATTLSAPARAAVAHACTRGALVGGMGHDALHLAPAGEYSGPWTREVRVDVHFDSTATVTTVLHAIPAGTGLLSGPGVSDGQTVTHTGTCGSTGMRWEVGGTVPERYRPRR